MTGIPLMEADEQSRNSEVQKKSRCCKKVRVEPFEELLVRDKIGSIGACPDTGKKSPEHGRRSRKIYGVSPLSGFG